MLGGALTTPTRTEDAAGVLIVGSVLTLLGWTLVPLWLLLSTATPAALVAAPVALAPSLVARGYFVRVVRGGARTANAGGAPSFVRWGTLYRDGVKSALLSAAYLLPLVAIAGVGGAAALFVELGRVDPAGALSAAANGGAIAGVGPEDAVLGVLGGFVGVLGVGYLVAFAYLRPAALARFAETGRLRDGLHPAGVARVAASGDYVAGWLLAMGTLFTGYALAAPFVPLLVGVALVFLTRLVVHALYGRGAAAALEHDRSGRDVGTGSGTKPDAGRSAADSVAESTAAFARSGTAGGIAPAETRVPGGDAASRAPPEASPAVQSGRSVALTGTDILASAAAAEADRDSNVDRDSNADRDADSSAGASVGDEGSRFEWGPASEDTKG